MAVPGGGVGDDVYATLLLSDTYLPGALVLAHSLRDAGTTKQLAVLVTLDSVSADVITQLKDVYDHVIPVPRIQNSQPANLHLMNRADLHSAFTKINLWKQTQFRKIVYIDADVVAYRAPDELFDITHAFSAAPDIGWPDLFNTGVMVLTPNLGDYYAMMAMAERNISFDGADQGLINMHFKNNYNRLSFTYNVTPSAHYQYIPAYQHFQSSINMVHFIGAEKPWFQGRHASTGSSPFNEMTGRWWAVYDRHYRVPSPTLAPAVPTTRSQPSTALVQYFTKGEYQPKATHLQTTTTAITTTGELHGDHHREHEQHFQAAPAQQHHHHAEHHEYSQHHHGPSHESHDHHHHHHHGDPYDGSVDAQPGVSSQRSDLATGFSRAASSFVPNLEGTEAEAREEQVPAPHHGAPPPQPQQEQKPAPFEPTYSSWDAARHPPPQGSVPEAKNFPQKTYEMSKDSAPFVAPERYPSPPKDMWFEVPKEAPAPPSTKPKAIFPWETNQSQPSRVFADVPLQTGEANAGDPDPSTEPSPIDPKGEPITPVTPTIQITPSDPWTAFTRTNAWDEVPEIERYVGAMQKHRRSRSLKSPGSIGMPGPGEGVDEETWKRRGSKLTDFPSEAERPSLPVTPAPVRRPKFWGGGGPNFGLDDEDDPLVPAAEGVPAQSDWDPMEQLQKLAQQQSEALLKRLGGTSPERDSSDLPPRPLPYGSEKLTSPTYVAQSANVVGPQPVEGITSSNAIRGVLSDPEATPRAAPTQRAPVTEATTVTEGQS